MTFFGVTGHQDIPKASRLFIEEKLQEILGNHKSELTGVSSLAAGADQIFAEIILRMRGGLHVVIPSQDYEASFQRESDLNRYKRFLEEADSIETLEFPSPSEHAYLAAGRRVVALSNVLIAVWDGEQAKGEGGTADIVHYAREGGKTVVVVWPDGLTR